MKIKKEKKSRIFYNTIFFLGLILIIFEISLYRKTIINIYIPISIILLTGLTAFIINRQHYKKTYSLNGNFYPLIQNVCSWGFIFCYIFMATNYYFSEEKTTTYIFPIKEKSSMPGSKYNRSKRQPLVRIDYFYFEKELVSRYVESDKVNKAESVILTIKKGLLGFDIIEKYRVF